MTKTEWDQANQELVKHILNFIHMNMITSTAQAKKVRNKAEREMGYVKHRIEYLLTKKYTEIYMMQASDEAVAGYGRAIAMDEFFQNRYIVGKVPHAGVFLCGPTFKLSATQTAADHAKPKYWKFGSAFNCPYL